MNLPLSFKEFQKQPTTALLFLVIIAVVYLYADGKMNYNTQIEKQGEKIQILEKRVELLSEQLRKSDSALSGALSRIEMLHELDKIK